METTISAASTSSSTSTNGNRGKLLIPRSITARRRKRASTGHSSGTGSHDDAPAPPPSRGRDIQSRDAADESDGADSLSPADERVGALDTDLPLRAPLSSHPSQIGYLTTSSPLVQAEHLQGSRTPTQADYERFARSATLPLKAADLDSAASTPSFTTTKTGLVPPSSKVRRSPSPAGRFRDVFRSRKGSSTLNSSPERQHPDPDHSERSNKGSDPRVPGISTTPSAAAPPPVIVADASHFATTSLIQDASHSHKPTDRLRRLSKGQRIDTTVSAARPETPPSNEAAAPVIVNTPPTPTDSKHPIPLSGTRYSTSQGLSRTSPSAELPNVSPPASVSSSMVQQKRARAGSLGPSKLSNYTLAPVSPNPEFAQSGQTTPSSGFFSSMISAAQNATSSLSNAVTNTNISAPWNNNNNNSKKPGSTTSPRDQDARDGNESSSKEAGSVEVESSLGPSFAPSHSASEAKEPAVKTLGLGDLSLSQLGIVDQPEKEVYKPAVAQPPAAHVQSRMSEVGFESRRRSESAPADPSLVRDEHAAHAADDAQVLAGRSSSVSNTTSQEDPSPPTGSIYGDKEKGDAFQRSNSIRSAIGRRRNRNSSAATGATTSTIAAAIAAANASVVSPMAPVKAPKLTGFAVASKKRNREFHNLFKSVPDDDYLIEDYSCALQREILAHGRLYVSEGYICFSSNILGWVTTLVMSFDEVVSVEKRSTALVFKNGLMISTLHAKHIFASFASRDSTYDLIIKIWKLGHPSLQSSLNGVRIDETGGDKTEKIEDGADASAGSRSLSASDEDSEDDSDEVYDEDAEDEDIHDTTYASDAGGAAADATTEKAATGKASGAAAASNGTAADKPKEAAAPTAGGDFPGPPTHAATDCGDTANHYDRVLADEVIPAPMGKVFSYIFGATSATWMIKWLSNDQKCIDIQTEDKKGLGPDNKTRTISYTKPLNASIGPKQTKCIVTEQIESLDFEKAIHVLCVTQTPDVPSGNVFTVKTKYCFSWAENNGTRVQMNCTIEWTGKSWLKAPIEKGANDGQAQYSKDLFAGLKTAILSQPRAVAANGGPPAKGSKKKGRKGKAAPTSDAALEVESPAKKPPAAAEDWGMLEPLHGVLGPAVDIVRPLLTGNVMYGLLVGLLVATWFGFGFPSSRQQPMMGYGQDIGYRAAYPERVAAYDEIWQREESELWNWLEERVGLDRLMDGPGAAAAAAAAAAPRKRAMETRMVEDKLRDDHAYSRDIREAIRVTEEKLKVLRSVVERQEAAGSA